MPRTVSFSQDMVTVYTIPRIENKALKSDLFYSRSDFQRFKREEKQRENRAMLQQIHRGLHPAATHEDKMVAKELLTMLEMRAGPENRAELLKSIAFAIARITRKKQNRKEQDSFTTNTCNDTTPSVTDGVVEVESEKVVADVSKSLPLKIDDKPVRRNAACHCTTPAYQIDAKTNATEQTNFVALDSPKSPTSEDTQKPQTRGTSANVPGILSMLLHPNLYMTLYDSLQHMEIVDESGKDESVEKPHHVKMERSEDVSRIKSHLRAGKNDSLNSFKTGSTIGARCTVPQCIEMPVRQLTNAKAA